MARAERGRHLRRRPHVLMLAAAAAAAASASAVRAQANDAVTTIHAPLLVPRAAQQVIVVRRLRLEQGLRSDGELLGLGNTSPLTRAGGGLSIRSTRGRLRGTFDYDGGVYTDWGQSTIGTRLENSLATRLSAEVVDQRAWIDLDANSRLVANSPLGMQPANGYPTANSSQYSSLRISPRWQERLTTNTDFIGRAYYARQWLPGFTQVTGLGTPNATSTILGRQAGGHGASARISHREGLTGLAVEASTDASNTRDLFESRSDRLIGTVNGLVPMLDLDWHATVGRERFSRSYAATSDATTWGGGLVWKPSPRTRASANYEHRAIGRTYSLALDYRAPLWAVAAGDSKGLNTNGLIAVPGSMASLFDLYMAQASTLEPDPVKRVDLVLNMLRAFGLDPLRQVMTPSYYASGLSMARTSFLRGSLIGRRSNLTLSLSRSRIDSLASTAALSGLTTLTSALTTTAVDLTGSHRLTPSTTITLGSNHLRSEGTNIMGQPLRSNQDTLNGSVRVALTDRSAAGVIARRSVYRSLGTTYYDNSVSATYDLRF